MENKSEYWGKKSTQNCLQSIQTHPLRKYLVFIKQINSTLRKKKLDKFNAFMIITICILYLLYLFLYDFIIKIFDKFHIYWLSNKNTITT